MPGPATFLKKWKGNVGNRGTSPLTGKRVVVTRAIEQRDSLCNDLQTRGATPILLPLISFTPPEDFAPLDAALHDFSQFDWLFLTSQNVLRSLLERCVPLKISLADALRNARIAAVGPATAHAATDAGLTITHVAENHQAIALAEELHAELLGCRVFLPRSDRANPELPEVLRQLGAEVVEAVAYRTVRPGAPDPTVLSAVSDGEADAILFFSPTAVLHFRDLLGEAKFRAVQEKAVFAAIGPVTARALQDAGAERIVSAKDTTVPAVIAALEKYFAGARQPLAGAKRG
jgi:uroporphyrinogen-III synthase